ncbi:hypothetical protein AAEJ74_17715 [Limnospira fusiformis PMC 851.14]|uniref:Uncharacterized protein n=1 Tax=Limnospira fusiformis PMC 851.14 TaxID=2219512 RepID=A0ABU9ENG2_LIMFS
MRSLYTKHSARLGVIKFLWSLRSSPNLLLVRSLYTTQAARLGDSSRLGGAIAKPNTVG